MKDSPGTLPQKRPWQLLVIGDGGTLLTQQDIEALTRILDLLPHVAGLDITTSAGSARVSRDVLALQLHFVLSSESMGNHDSGYDEWRYVC
ncbi:hypothetical protein SXCC_00320 [Gluconacetobacter sp. SXCC-1]|uniref:Uncharacterized protein n=1 Tax=Komagataeibacter swingsii TaxID=215220 RepID=A0A850P781_9PROT|nr:MULTISPECIES: hypothetical protein [Komagataeibacter]EGG79012.1 hypothetical protein SXCC_00320 [Gluconacetobacter sp. SXCC-1]NVN38559.1 hypothetical protein [Komagataeibacter swingsii]